MQRLMVAGRATHDVLMPLDLDEFVAHYDRRSRRLTAGGVCGVIDGLNLTQPHGFTFNTVAAVGAPTECPRGALRHHAGGDEKMFAGAGATIDYVIQQGPRLRKISWNHGNHRGPRPADKTDLVLIEYRYRSQSQFTEKVLKAWTGKGYPTDVKQLETDPKTGKPFKGGAGGNHNRATVIGILTGVLPAPPKVLPYGPHRSIDLHAFAARLRGAMPAAKSRSRV
mmetsp:Transcript_12945/g.38533  ORF Transcript_12945/g.38533 Transcript_12945/m.38533 type:complete len:224 (+) Transcript_12945:602-1273(+)